MNPKELHKIGGHIKDVVDFEGTSLEVEARFIVKRGVDEEVHPNIYII